MPALIILKTGRTLPELAARKGDFEDWILAGLQRVRATVSVIEVSAGESLPAPEQAAGVIITGSHAMVTDRHSWSGSTAHWLRGAVEQRVPVLGICYGHQLLAQALGGVVSDNPRGDEYGTVPVRLCPPAATDPLLSGLADPLYAHVSHTQTVRQLPPGATRLAYSALDENQAFVVNGCAWGVQFHPEFDADIMRAYLTAKHQALRAQGRHPDELLAAVHDTSYGGEILRRFARLTD